MDFVARQIIARKPKKVGVYRLIMKAGSDNFRASAIQGVMHRLQGQDIDLCIYEPEINQTEFHGLPVVCDFGQFSSDVDVIIANRMTDELSNVADKVYTRDLFGKD